MTHFSLPPAWRWILLIAAALLIISALRGGMRTAETITPSPAPSSGYTDSQLPNGTAFNG